MKTAEKEGKVEQERIRKRNEVKQEEKDRQEKEGVVSKPKVIGRFKY